MLTQTSSGQVGKIAELAPKPNINLMGYEFEETRQDYPAHLYGPGNIVLPVGFKFDRTADGLKNISLTGGFSVFKQNPEYDFRFPKPELNDDQIKVNESMKRKIVPGVRYRFPQPIPLCVHPISYFTKKPKTAEISTGIYLGCEFNHHLFLTQTKTGAFKMVITDPQMVFTEID